MKSLRESLIAQNKRIGVNEYTINEIKEFIKTHYCLCPRYRGVLATPLLDYITDENFDENFKINRKGGQYIVDSNNIVVFEASSDSLVNDLFIWGKVKSFLINNHNTLTSLKGAPEEVDKDFDCWGIYLISLEGAPKKVGRNFSCEGCNKLESLTGVPEYVGGSFSCKFCPCLKNLIGAPEEVGKNFDCRYCHSLKNLEGAPKKVGKNFDCSTCTGLKSLIGAPEEVGGNFNFDDCPYVYSSEGKPKKIGGKSIGIIKL